MKVVRFSASIRLALLMSCLGFNNQLFAISINTDLQPTGQIKALGACASYFDAGKQVKRLPRNMRCSFEVSFGQIADCATCASSPNLQGSNVQLRGRYVDRNRLLELSPLLQSEGRFFKVATLKQNNRAVLTIDLKKQSRFLQLGAFIIRLEALSEDEYCNSLNEVAQQRLDQLQSCEIDNDCGQALFPYLENSGVGPVVRSDADRVPLLNFYEEMRLSGCYPPDIFILPIFQIDGHICESGRCNWRYAAFLN